MIPLRSSYRIRESTDDRLEVRTSSGRRITYLIVFIVLVGSFIVGFDSGVDLTGRRLVGTFVVAVIALVSLGVFGYARSISVTKSEDCLQIRSSFFGVVVGGEREYALSAISSFILWTVVLRKAPKRRNSDVDPSSVAGRYRDYMEPRSRLFRLYIDTEERRFKLAESSYREEIDNLAGALAAFTGITIAAEEG